MKVITDSDELVMWLADKRLYTGPLADVPVGIVDVYKGLISMFLCFGDMRRDDFNEPDLAEMLRRAVAKTETLRCDKRIYESFAILLVEVASCEFSVSLETLVRHLADWSHLLKDLEFVKLKEGTVVRSQASLHRKGVLIDVVLHTLEDADTSERSQLGLPITGLRCGPYRQKLKGLAEARAVAPTG